MSDFDRLCMHIFPFLKTENSVKTEYNISYVYGEGSVDNIMCSKLFRKFHESSFKILGANHVLDKRQFVIAIKYRLRLKLISIEQLIFIEINSY